MDDLWRMAVDDFHMFPKDVRVLLARLTEMKQRSMKASWKLTHLSSELDASGTDCWG